MQFIKLLIYKYIPQIQTCKGKNYHIGESLSKVIKESTVNEAKNADTAYYIYAADGSKRDPIGTATDNSGNIKVVSIACRIQDGKSQVGVYGYWNGEDEDCVMKWITIN